MGRKVVIIQGANFGSEAKGAVALAVCEREKVKYAVRTGSINAGHTIVHNDKKIAFQQLPVGAVLPYVTPVIGLGTYINQGTLMREVEYSQCGNRIVVDDMCGVHLDDYTDEAKIAARNLKIGATGKGCAEAIVHKIEDRGNSKVPLLYKHQYGRTFPTADTAEMLTAAYDRGDLVLLEGTQGTLLDFHAGPYPFVTSRQTIASAWVCEAGLSPSLNYEVVLVARTYPIRVAGNSGPMGNEIDWPTLARRMNKRLSERVMPLIVAEDSLKEYEAFLEAAQAKYDDKSECGLKAATDALKAMEEDDLTEVMKLFETTTVTKRLRRIAELDVKQLALTVKKERPAYVVLTFLNYVMPELVHTRVLHAEARQYVQDLQRAIGAEVRYVTIGPRSEDVIPVGTEMY